MGYKGFRKTVKGPDGKPARRWYYHWTNAAGKQHQKICKNCRNRSEAENYIRTIPAPADVAPAPGEATISIIAGTMYVPGGVHYARRVQLDKSTDPETMSECRRYIKRIIGQWSDLRLRDLGVDRVMPYLFDLDRSGKWKNRFLEVLGEVYIETAWYG